MRCVLILSLLFSNFLIPAAFAASESAWNLTTSDDENPADHSANITSYSFYTHVGHLLITPATTFTLNDQSSTTNTNTDAPTGDSNISSSSANLGFQYGLLTDGLRIGISEGELFSTATSHTNGAGVTSLSRSSGLSDPTATVYYRFLQDDAKTHISGDLNVAVSPSWVTHDLSSTAMDGSNGKGYGDVTVTMPYYWWENLGSLLNEVDLSPSAEHQFSGNATGATNASSYSRSSQWSYSGTIGDRFHFSPEFFFQAAANLNFPYAVTDFYLDSTSHLTITHLPFYVAPTFELGYRFLRNVLFETAYTYTNYTSTNDTSATKNIDDTLTIRFLIDI